MYKKELAGSCLDVTSVPAQLQWQHFFVFLGAFLCWCFDCKKYIKEEGGHIRLTLKLEVSYTVTNTSISMSQQHVAQTGIRTIYIGFNKAPSTLCWSHLFFFPVDEKEHIFFLENPYSLFTRYKTSWFLKKKQCEMVILCCHIFLLIFSWLSQFGLVPM